MYEATNETLGLKDIFFDEILKNKFYIFFLGFWTINKVILKKKYQE